MVLEMLVMIYLLKVLKLILSLLLLDEVIINIKWRLKKLVVLFVWCVWDVGAL